MKTKEEKSIETPEFYIKGNIMTWKDHMIQLSNVSSISTTRMEPLAFPTWVVLVFLAGLVFIKMYLVMTILCFVVGGGYIVYWYTENDKRRTTTNLIISLNSGRQFLFVIKNRDFMQKILDVLESIIRGGGIGEKSISVNIKDCSFGGDVDVLNHSDIH